MTFDKRSDNSSVCFRSEYKAIWKENLAIYQKSLTKRTFFPGTPSIFLLTLQKFISVLRARTVVKVLLQKPNG